MEERERCMKMAQDRGDFVTGDDGYMVFWPDRHMGYLDAIHLRWLADELDKRNASWHEQVMRTL